MSRSPKQVRRSRTLPLWLAVGLIIVLSVAALALSYVALARVGSGEHPGLPVRPEASPSEAAQASAAPLPINSEPEVAAAEEPEVAAAGEQSAATTSQHMIAMVNGTAMRANGGTCENPGTVGISLDAGQSWDTSDSLVTAGATQILRLLPTAPSLVQAVALDEYCEPQVYRSADLGASWTGPLSVAGTWYFDPSNPAQVGTPDGVKPLSCEGAELVAEGDRAAVLCADGSVVVTVDRGTTWSEVTGVENVLALDYSSGSYVMAQGGDPSCEGVRLTTLSESASTIPDGCFETELAKGELNAGNIAVAQSGTYTLLWAGDDVVTSTDGGTTWL